MKLEKAIEILQEKRLENEPHWERGDRDALQLGIEALEWIQEARTEGCFRCPGPLPGETED